MANSSELSDLQFQQLKEKLWKFMKAEIYPNEELHMQYVKNQQ